MRESIIELLEKFQMRKTEKQKQEFINFLTNFCDENNYKLKIESNEKGSYRNLIVGDVENADMVLTAHYDTCSNAILPMFILISNFIVLFLSQLIPFALFYVVALIIGRFFDSPILFVILFNVLLIGYVCVMMFGKANKHTANDNTSGVATLMSIMEDIDVADRDKVAFVFFDLEEAGLIGSMNFKKKYKNVMKTKPLINFDCVSDGKHVVFVTSRKLRNNSLFGLVQNSVAEVEKKQDKLKSEFEKASKCFYPSDQLLFPVNIGVASFHKIPVLGYFMTRIHSKYDTKFEVENIDFLTKVMIESIKKI